LDYIKKVEKVYLMVTGLAKWLRERRKKERVEKTKRKKAIQRATCKRKKNRGDIHIASSLLAHTRSSVCSLGLLFAQSSCVHLIRLKNKQFFSQQTD
jgi:hypothetical protein